MSQTGVLTRVVSVDGIDFNAAIAQSAGLMADLPVGGRWGSGVGIVRTLFITSEFQVAWEINFYATNAGRNLDPNVDSFQGRYGFNAADGVQTEDAGLFRYYVDGMTVLVSDFDAGVGTGGDLHVELVPRGASKSLGAGFRIGVTVEIPGGWG